MSLTEFNKKAEEAILKLRSLKESKAIVVTHDDADGLSSGAIIKRALEREGIEVKIVFLEKLFPEVIENVQLNNELIFYTDIGSAHADLISKLNKEKHLTIILDHHNPSECFNNNVYDLNLEKFGFKGETDFSGSSITFLFSEKLNKENTDLIYLALVGSKEIPSGFLGLNKELLSKALSIGIIKEEKKDFVVQKLKLSLGELFSDLQIFGSVGYYRNGPEVGIEVALNGLTKEYKMVLERLERERKEANKKLLEKLLSGGLNKLSKIQWFDASDFFSGMGTKVVGTFCSYLSYQYRIIDQDKYIVGMMKMPSEIPNWGRLKNEYYKISVRVPKKLQQKIENGKAISAVNLLQKAVGEFGYADGHDLAASAIVLRGKETEVLKRANEIAERFN